jgi:NADH-quinone oxidoreductase subunit G
MSQVKITIDGKECHAEEGEFILNVARANDIFIPAICYLNRCSPTLACRICLVESNGKQVYACNAKVKDGMEVITSTENIERERKAIMEVYDVNHPLECGVCDQSGECELQNYTLHMKVDQQSYAIKDTHKPVQNWGHIQYDPALCIMCEKCVTVCKDMIGDTALKTVPRGSDKLDPKYKETMPKDSYAMWNKLNKSLIGAVAGETLDCTSCGECSAVCPVGAIVGTDFKFSTNAWELEKIPSTCAHCSIGCSLNYEVKHTTVHDDTKKIYRVTNDSHFATLCGAGRYGYDFENRVAEKDESKFQEAVEYLKNADTVLFNSQITNEEALILERLREKLGFKLVNRDAFEYGRFLKVYSEITGKSLYSGDLNEVRSSNFVVAIGSAFKTDSPNSRFALNNSIKRNKGAGLYFHPIKDPVVDGFGKSLIQVPHNPHEENIALKWVLKRFGKDIPETIAKDLEKVEFSDFYISEAFEADLEKNLKKKDKFFLMIGQDLYGSENWKNLAELVGLIELYTDFSIILLPTNTNSLGVSQICELSETSSGQVFGYNEKGGFTFSALGDGDLDAPALNQQEGTFVNIDKRVVNLNVALPYNGYTLNDIANEFFMNGKENTIDYTKELFKKVDFDSFGNGFTNGGEDLRGYVLDIEDVEKRELKILPKSNVPKIGKSVIYLSNPVLQFGLFTNKTHELKENGGLYVSPEFANKLKVKDGDEVAVATKLGSLKTKAIIDNKISGDIPYLPDFDKTMNARSLFNSYRFAEAKISKV